ncbi:MAG TPA: ATP-grasp domain-containing protein [Streptosporangiaceae bacterium]
MPEKVRLAVPYDVGSAAPLEISRVSRTFAPLGVVLGDSDHAAEMAPLFDELRHVGRAGLGWAERLELLTRWRPDGIVTFSERMLRPTAAWAKALSLPFHTPETAELVTDKYLQREALAAAGVAPVASSLVTAPESWPAAIARTGLPAVVKPRRGEGSRNTYLVEDAADGRRLVERLLAGAERELVVEELLIGRPEPCFGDYVSVECACVAGAVHPIAVTGKFALTPPFRESGQFWPAALDPEEEAEVVEVAAAALRALGVTTGLSHTEIKLTADGPRVIEVNGRLGGQVAELARRATGVDLVEVACGIALGEDVEVPRAAPGRVYFQHHTLAPRQPCTVVEVPRPGPLPGIDRFRPFVRAGERLAGGTRTRELDLLSGDAPDHAAMMRTLATALPEITYLLDTADGRVRASAVELTSTLRWPSPAR